MKHALIFSIVVFFAIKGKSQTAPKAYDPCQKLDTNKIKELVLGTWVDMKDTSHIMNFTEDSLTERILIEDGGVKKVNWSFWSYKFTDNIFGSDDVTCYSLVEYKEGYSHHVDFAINSINDSYMLLGASGKTVFKKKK
jgi:hypothetical protein